MLEKWVAVNEKRFTVFEFWFARHEVWFTGTEPGAICAIGGRVL